MSSSSPPTQAADSLAKVPYPLSRLNAQQRYDDQFRSLELRDRLFGVELRFANWHVSETEKKYTPDHAAGRMPVILAYTMPRTIGL